MKEEHRDQRGFGGIESFARDVRYGWTALGNAPGFSSILVGVLALGIGATVAMFSVLDAVLLKPLPFSEPDRIVSVWDAPRPGVVNATTAPDFLEWRRVRSVFDALSAEQPVSAALTGMGDAVRIAGKAVTADYFRVFPVRTHLGRTFSEEEYRAGASPSVVISYAAWRNQFGGDPEILHRRPVLDGEAHQVVGVLAPGAFDRDETRFWKPLIFTAQQRSERIHWLTVYGRLARDTTLAQAREQMGAVYSALTEGRSSEEREAAIVIEPLSRVLVGPGLQRSIYVGFGAVALVLLIACANVANLLLAKGAAREKEMAVRAALGASRGRLVQQLLIETFVLCVAGGLAGIAVAASLIRLARPVLEDALPFTAAVTLDARALLFAGGLVLAVCMIAGTLPAIRTSLGRVSGSLNRSGRGTSGAHAGMRRAIVAFEVALSVVLLSGALLLLKSLLKLQGVENGVRSENVITMSLDLPLLSYRTPEQAALFYGAVSERLRGVPGVVDTGMTTALPLLWIGNGEALQPPGMDELVRVRFKRVDSGYFGTMGIPVLSGRGIGRQDHAGTSRVVVINEALAARLAEVAGIQKPVGRLVHVSGTGYEGGGASMQQAEIVGIIRNERVAPPGRPTPPVVYVPLAQAPIPSIKLVVRSQTEIASVMPGIREAIREVDPALPVGDVATMEQVSRQTLTGATRPAWMTSIFAAIAVLLTGIGLYGVVSYSVAMGRREIGIRMAFGARASSVVAEVLRHALATVVIGLAFGMAGSAVLTRLLRGLLFGVSPLDGMALATACASMVAIGLLAAFVPAARAAHVDPAMALRDEG